MIYTVTLNSSIDYFAISKDFGTGKINRTNEEHMVPGGKGINVSMVLNNLGQKNKALGFVAGFTGQKIVNMLDEMGVDNDMIYSDSGISRINVKIKSPISGESGQEIFEETDLNGMGPDISEELIDKLYEQLDALMPGDYLILSGGRTPSMPVGIYGDIVKRMNEKNVHTVVDATGSLLLNAILQKPFLIKPNEEELSELSNIEMSSDEVVIRVALDLQESGARNILVSRGEKGAILITEDKKIIKAEAPKGEVISTIGAGDSMLAGFIDGYIRTGDMEAALKEGICAGSASAFSVGLANKEEVMDLLKMSI